MLFDIEFEGGGFAPQDMLRKEAVYLGIDCAQMLGIFKGLPDFRWLRSILHTTSSLGGALVEGVVFKQDPADRTVLDKFGDRLTVKHVSHKFRETNDKVLGDGRKPVIDRIVDAMVTDARRTKVVQHLREEGSLTNSHDDIALFVRALQEDVLLECGDQIKEMLWEENLQKLRGQIARGAAEWYKVRMLGEEVH